MSEHHKKRMKLEIIQYRLHGILPTETKTITNINSINSDGDGGKKSGIIETTKCFK